MTTDTEKKPAEKPKSKPVSAEFETFQDQEIKRMLVTGEEVVLRAELHNAIYWKSAAVLILGLLFFVMVAVPLGVLLLVVSVIMFLTAMITKHYLLLAITNKRVLARYGLLQMDVVDIRFSKIESIDLERMLPGHLLGYATVVVMGTGQRFIRIPFIANAEAFRRYHNEITLSGEGIHEDEIEDLPAGSSGAPDKRNKAPRRGK
ncbi:MAG: PH domain-containing protein [Alphaproteobacteria bacterium]|nr:PH domain-containing protein [Alphaproteobacteria bacterium]MCB9975455.1 PH domain-containing protein [Rhodospirillales bacterium]